MEDIRLNKMRLGIIGTGGFAREVLQLAKQIQKTEGVWFNEINFVEIDDFFKDEYVDSIRVLKISECDLSKMKFVIGIGDPNLKNKILKELPLNIAFTSLISPQAFIADDLKFQAGLIIMPFSYVSCNVTLGHHVHLNAHCTIGHDTVIGDYFTSACSVMIAGNNNISKNCYFGMNSSTRQGITIMENVSIGLNSGVVKDINKSGTYIGTPAKFLFK
jgi:sugar O-acyltransferase (sialic acid O-acetyltransferase NeuD family)